MKPTCSLFENPPCIDLILINKKELFKHPEVNQVGISDHNSFAVTFLKSQFVRGNSKTKIYRDYSQFDMDAFKQNLGKNFRNRNICEYTHFQNTFVGTLDKHAPIKKKTLKSNNNSFIIKPQREAY